MSDLWQQQALGADDILDYDADLAEDDSAGRLFLYYNSSQTISTSFAVFLVLSISAVLASIAGAAYFAILSGGSSGQSRRGRQFRTKRSDDDDAFFNEPYSSDDADQLVRILIVLAEMESTLRRSGLRGGGEHCKALRVCQLARSQTPGFELSPDFGVAHLDMGKNMVTLLDRGRELLEHELLGSDVNPLDAREPVDQLVAFLRASDLGLRADQYRGRCETAYQELCASEKMV